MSDKSAIREVMLARRNALPESERVRRSEHIREHLSHLPVFQRATQICCYWSIGSEVATHAIIADLLAKPDSRLCLPRVAGTRLELREISQLDDLITHAWCIREPKPSCPLIQPTDIDLFLVPGVAFTPEGHRIGYGKGYYDRVLHNTTGHMLGLAYSMQILDEPFEPDAWDICLNGIVEG